MAIWYCTREDVKSALDQKATALSNRQVDRAVEASSRYIDDFLHRKFFPWTGTRFFQWPPVQTTRPWRLWLEENDLIRVTEITSGGVLIPPANYFLEPANSGPPFTSVEINLGSSSAWSGGITAQRSIEITGVFGYSASEEDAGILESVIADDTVNTVNVTDASLLGVGSLLRIDDERMTVLDRTWLDTGLDLLTPMAASQAAVTVTVSDGTAYQAGEVLLLDAEKMLITDVAGNNLIVKRAWDGSVMAAHTASDIFAERKLTVERGVLGTTAAAHSDGATVFKHEVPGLVEQLCVGESIDRVLQETSGFAREERGQRDLEGSIGYSGRPLHNLREMAYAAYGRKVRNRTV